MTNLPPRWQPLIRLVEDWYSFHLQSEGKPAMSQIADAEARLNCAFPTALRECFTFQHSFQKLFRQNHFLSPEQCYISNDALVFCVENQHVVDWRIPLATFDNEDPPVWIYSPHWTSENELWIVENASLSQFMYQMMLAETLLSGNYNGNTEANPSLVAAIQRNYQSIDLPSWHWPTYPTRFFQGNNILIELNANDWVWIAAWNRDAFERLINTLNVSWTYLSTESEP